MNIVMNDLYSQYLDIRQEIDGAISEVISTSQFIRGEFVEKFEEEFARVVGADHCISCGNGTDALYIALRSLGVKLGDEVIVPAISWISSASVVTQSGGRVVFCDIDPATNTMSVDDLRNKITEKTVGIILVHLYGHPCDMDPILKFANSNKIWIVEDCAQAHLTKYNGKTVGTFGSISTFSFYPGKNLGAMGDGGAIITNDDSLALFSKKFARHGGLSKHSHEFEGINSRLDGLQAAILSVKLKYLKQHTSQRRDIAKKYDSSIMAVECLKKPIEQFYAFHSWHLYVVEVERREHLGKHLAQEGIQTTVNYPVSLPFLDAYKYLGHKITDFPVAYGKQSKLLSLPLYPGMPEEDQEYVAASINKFYDEH
ncbi:DegT/DnrJ/EryC1/StrS family aminotransferase [Amylibacter sp.]|nr:DegT/DnrJ/EryC1/StrS family aminotransferase [Amylibacter sp.]